MLALVLGLSIEEQKRRSQIVFGTIKKMYALRQ